MNYKIFFKLTKILAGIVLTWDTGRIRNMVHYIQGRMDIMMNTDKIRIFLFIRTTFLRRGVDLALSFEEDMQVLSAGDLNEVLSLGIEQSPQVAIIDIDNQSDGGLTVIRQLKKSLPETGVIALASNSSETQLFQLLKVGVAACIDKGITPDQLLDSVRRVYRGECPINEIMVTNPNLANQVFRQFQELCSRSDKRSMITRLTPREIEILKYISQNYMNKQIAVKLGISEQTIKNHVTSILRKLKANARTEAVDVAKQQGLIELVKL